MLTDNTAAPAASMVPTNPIPSSSNGTDEESSEPPSAIFKSVTDIDVTAYITNRFESLIQTIKISSLFDKWTAEEKMPLEFLYASCGIEADKTDKIASKGGPLGMNNPQFHAFVNNATNAVNRLIRRTAKLATANRYGFLTP